MWINVLAFLITIFILVTIHEWGHFAVARAFNVKIKVFSIGFGKKIFSWHGKKDNTRYQIALLPLGGFVQMLGESADEEISEEDKNRTFKAQAAWKRFLIVFAGPLINLIFAVLVFALLFMNGVQGLKPEVVRLKENSPAEQSALQVGDLIRKVGAKEIYFSADLNLALLALGGEIVEIEFERNGVLQKTNLDLSAWQAGDEQKINDVSGLYLAGNWLDLRVAKIIENSPAAEVLQIGDEVLEINNQAVDFHNYREVFLQNPQQSALKIRRAGKILDFKIDTYELNGERYLGLQWERPDLSAYLSKKDYSFGSALIAGWQKTIDNVALTYNMFTRMISGKASLDNLGGPIMIADIAGKTINYGWDVFLNFLGIISLSLAAINLLPIPMLDGGHMLIYGIEMLSGKVPGERFMKYWQIVGGIFLYCLMVFVLFKDFWRYLF